MSERNTRILLADDHSIVRQGIRSLLENQQDMDVVAEADSGRTAVEMARALRPDVVLMDISMPDLNGVEATRQVLEAVPEAKVIALSVHSDRRYVKGLLSAGAIGYLLKDCAFEELVRAVRAVVSGQAYLSPRVAGIVVEDSVRAELVTRSQNLSDLTARQREVLELLAVGKTSKEIAFELGVSSKTVDRHRQQLMKKLEVHSIAEVTKYAIRQGLTSLDL